MIGLLSVVAYFASLAWAFREVTNTPQREGMILLSGFVLIAMSVITGNIITGGE